MSRQTLTRVRWPLAPLLVAAGHPPVTVLAARLGVATRTISRWRHNGLTDDQADRAAVMLGYHPLNVWTDWHQV